MTPGRARELAAAGLLTLLIACRGGGLYVRSDSIARVRRLAIVQYVINPHVYTGTLGISKVRNRVIETNIVTFGQLIAHRGWQLMPLAEVVSARVYQSGQVALPGYFTMTGMRFFTGAERVEQAMLDPTTASTLCDYLGVDAVVAIYDSYELIDNGPPFVPKSSANSKIVLNAYDRSGAVIWSDNAQIPSPTTMWAGGPTGIAVAASPDVVVQAFRESFTGATRLMLSRLR